MSTGGLPLAGFATAATMPGSNMGVRLPGGIMAPGCVLLVSNLNEEVS